MQAKKLIVHLSLLSVTSKDTFLTNLLFSPCHYGRVYQLKEFTCRGYFGIKHGWIWWENPYSAFKVYVYFEAWDIHVTLPPSYKRAPPTERLGTLVDFTNERNDQKEKNWMSVLLLPNFLLPQSRQIICIRQISLRSQQAQKIGWLKPVKTSYPISLVFNAEWLAHHGSLQTFMRFLQSLRYAWLNYIIPCICNYSFHYDWE